MPKFKGVAFRGPFVSLWNVLSPTHVPTTPTPTVPSLPTLTPTSGNPSADPMLCSPASATVTVGQKPSFDSLNISVASLNIASAAGTGDCFITMLNVVSEEEIVGQGVHIGLGSFVIKRKCSGMTDAVIVSPPFGVGCGVGFTQANATTCVAAPNVTQKGCAWTDVRIGSQCRKMPVLVVAADAQDVFIQLSKTSQSSALSYSFTLGAEGSFDMTWSMRCEANKWLVCLEPGRGELLAGSGEVAAARLLLNVTSQNDYSTSLSDLMGAVLIESRAKSVDGDVPFEGKQISVRIRTRVLADVCIQPGNVELSADDGLRSVGASGSRIDVVTGAPIVVLVHVYDCEGLPIGRFVPIWLGRRRDAANISAAAVLLRAEYEGTDRERNVLQVSLPRSWLASPGEIAIFVSTSNTGAGNAVDVILVITDAGTGTMAKVVTGVVIAVLIVGLLIYLAVLAAKNRHQAASLVKAFVEYELLLGVETGFELFDILGDFLSLLAVNADENSGDLRFWFVAFFGMSFVASLIVMASNVELLVVKLRSRKSQKHFHRVSSATSPAAKAAFFEEKRDMHRRRVRKALGYLLIGFCEDLPFSMLSMVYLLQSDKSPQPVIWLSFSSSLVLLGFKVAQLHALHSLWYGYHRWCCSCKSMGAPQAFVACRKEKEKMDQERKNLFAAARDMHAELAPLSKASRDVAAWQPSKVIEWFLNEVNLRDYEATVRTAGVTGKQLCALSDEHLHAMGIASPIDCEIVLAHVERLLHRCHFSPDYC